MRNGIGPILGRIFGVVASLLLLGIMLRLVTALLAPVLPAQLTDADEAGSCCSACLGGTWAPIAAVLIVCALCWVVLGRRHSGFN